MRRLLLILAATTVIGPLLAGTSDDLSLGKLSEKYESGNRGPGTVSTGKGDPGGVSYGTYQLASKIGRADQFVAKYYPAEFKGLKGGSDEFTKTWKELASRDPKGLHANEHAYIRETHYDPQVAILARTLQLDLAKRSAALRDVVWSVAVQHGPRTDVITTAAKPLVEGRSIDAIGDEELIKAIYAERGRMGADGKLVRFARVDDRLIPALTNRFKSEQADALKALAQAAPRSEPNIAATAPLPTTASIPACPCEPPHRRGLLRFRCR